MKIWSQNKNRGILFLAAMTMAVIFLLLMTKGLPGSQVDWIAQHSVFPDYFRKLFYETGEVYPDFAMQIGGGQNIFNFAYYGLLNPCIMLSWFFPWISMDLWIMGLSMVLYTASVLLFYYWIYSRGLEERICVYVSLMFMMAAPLLYHFCVQIMFVNYMPFLCMGLIGTDLYFEKKKAGLLCISVLFIILTSFYFSIGCIGCLCIYALYCYLKSVQDAGGRITMPGITGAALKYMAVILTGVLLSCFYLVPTAAALFGGRSSGDKLVDVNLLALFVPSGDQDRVLYDTYGIGVNYLALAAMLSGLFEKKTAGKVLSISLFLVTACPLFSYALNGFLYNRGKVLIPFLPLICFQTGRCLVSLNQNRKGMIPAILILFIYFVLTAGEGKEFFPSWADMLLLMISFLFYCKWKNDIRIVVIPSILILALSTWLNWQESDVGMELANLNQKKREEISQMIESVTEKNNDSYDELYRVEYYGTKHENFENINRIFHINQNITSLYSSVCNSCYSNFRNQIFDVEKSYRNILMENISENPVFRRMMGVKYIISAEKPVGYEEVEGVSDSNSGLKLYTDEKAVPLAYATTNTLSHYEYGQLKFPYNQLVFLQYAIVGESGGCAPESENQNPVGQEPGLKENGLMEIVKENGLEEIVLEEIVLEEMDLDGQLEGSPQGETMVELPCSDQEQILFVRFHVKNHRKQDVIIKVGNASNTLCSQNHIYYNDNTIFTYAVGIQAGQKEILFDFGKGNYEITDSEAYLVPVPGDVSRQADRKWRMEISGCGKKSGKKTREVLSGSINMGENGYLITSIPYDENFVVYVDGKEQTAELVNEGFIGTRLEKGSHEILLYYRAPGKKEGILLTIAGMIILSGYCAAAVYSRLSEKKTGFNVCDQ